MIDTLSQHITTLLRRNDCVIVPGLGAFVATRREALVSANVLTPPAWELSFNPAMTHDDGLLAASVSRRLRISFTQAREKVAAEVQLLLRRLHSEGAVQLSNIGILSRRSGGRLDFTAETPWLTLPEIRISQPVPVPVLEISTAEDNQKAVAIVRVPLRMQWLRIAAAIVILSIIGFTISTPIDIDTAQNASLATPAFTAPEAPIVEPIVEPAMTLNFVSAPADGAVKIEERLLTIQSRI